MSDHLQKPGSLSERSPRGKLVIASCQSAQYLAESVTQRLNEQYANRQYDYTIPHLENIDFRFSDSEIGVRLDIDVSGCDVFLFQSLYDPCKDISVSEHYLALCIAVRAFREWGAHKITAVLPYLAYARQDKPTRFEREPTTARLMADLVITAGVDRLVTWHPHYQQIHGFYSGIPVDVLEPFDYFINLFETYRGREEVILVAPDVGASKFATHLGHALDLQVAITSKFHPEREKTEIVQIIGDLADKRIAIVVDDMMSSGGTVHGVVEKLVSSHHIEDVIIAVSHNLCTETAYNRLLDLQKHHHLHDVHVTNSIPQTDVFRRSTWVTVHDLTSTLSDTIQRIHYDRL